MKKLLSAALALALSLSLVGCGESMEVPTEPTQTEPLWALAPEDRPTETAAVTETTVPVITTVETTEETEAVTEAAEATETTLAETEAPTEPAYKMEDKFQSAEATMFVKKGVNCRSQANVDSQVVTVLPQGTEVVQLGTSADGWTAILYEDQVRYVSTDYLVQTKPDVVDPNQPVETEMDDQVYTNHRVNMREGPGMDQPVIVMIPESTELHRIGSTTSGWFKVEYKDKVGYVMGSYIMPKYVDSEEHPEETVVNDTVRTTREVNLRKGPGTDRQILTRVPEGTEISRSATTSNEWSKVTYEGHEGYISSKYLETVTGG